MVHALFVANYIIEYSNRMNYDINNLKLQKLLYFANVRNIIENNSPIFEESMEKWKYGPVVPSVYHEYKRFGAFPITNDDLVNEYIEFSSSPFAEFSDINIIEYSADKVENIELIEDTVDSLANLGAFDLVEITHTHEPWQNFEEKIMNGVQGIKYTTEEIRDYFINNPQEQLWAQYQ